MTTEQQSQARKPSKRQETKKVTRIDCKDEAHLRNLTWSD